MSDTSQGPGWWQASDGKWYPPEQAQPAVAPLGGAPAGDLADWGQRAVGILIDFAIIFVLWIVAFVITLVFSAISSTLGALVGLVVYIALSLAWLYMGFLVGAKGRSPGMAITGLRCVSAETGQLIGGGMGVVRTIAHIVDSIGLLPPAFLLAIVF